MNTPLSKGLSITSWILQLVAAVILFQTLFFKFTGAKESIYIFSTVGMEPWGRIGSGVVELIASIMAGFTSVNSVKLRCFKARRTM